MTRSRSGSAGRLTNSNSTNFSRRNNGRAAVAAVARDMHHAVRCVRAEVKSTAIETPRHGAEVCSQFYQC
uniref:Uncharacterized protein n=1 Tax=uncultured marine virus TaxID=186617 RepID=A0A0F7L8R0_9VIRU|nr:hypothetical protein [uncultured marine virus]